MTDYLVMSTDEAIQWKPVAHVGFSEESVYLHHSEIVKVRESVGTEEDLSVNENQAGAEEETDMGGAECSQFHNV